jgi:methionine synthase I (cobalamin-dependent)
LPVLLSLTYWKTPERQETPQLHGSGRNGRQVAAAVCKSGLAALGVNCGRDIGPEQVACILMEYRNATGLPLFCRVNAGSPVWQDGQWSYPLVASRLAGQLPELLAAGASMIGGCCGTTPEHIQALHLRLGELASVGSSSHIAQKDSPADCGAVW